MVTTILTGIQTQQSTTPDYQIKEEDRQALNSRSPLAILRKRIEEQRVAFVLKFGNDFGQ